MSIVTSFAPHINRAINLYYAFSPVFYCSIPIATMIDAEPLIKNEKSSVRAFGLFVGSAFTGVLVASVYPLLIPGCMGYYIYKRATYKTD